MDRQVSRLTELTGLDRQDRQAARLTDRTQLDAQRDSYASRRVADSPARDPAPPPRQQPPPPASAETSYDEDPEPVEEEPYEERYPSRRRAYNRYNYGPR